MRNGKSQVLDLEHSPIPRLYAAGAVSHSCGQVYSMFGANMSENLAFGRISGRNAAAEKPWDAKAY